MKLVVPSNLKIQKLIDKYPVNNICGFHKDKVFFVCNCIYRQMEKLNDGVHADKNNQFYVPINATILKNEIGWHYKQVIDWMVKAGVIIPDKSWQEGEVSQGYRFTDHYLGSGIRWVAVTSKMMFKKFDAVKIKKETKYPFLPRVVQRLEKWFDGDRLKIDATKANEIISDNEAIAIRDAKGDANKIIKAKTTGNAYKTVIASLHDGLYHITQDPFGYRVHTPLTRLGRELRKYVTYDGKPLVEVDITGSQLFFSNLLLDYRFWNIKGHKNYKPFLNQLWDGINIYNTITLPNTIMFLKNCEILYGQGFQEHSFFRNSMDGLVYERVIEELEISNYFPDSYTDKDKRDEVKKILLEQLFANPKNPDHWHLYNGNCRLIWDCFKALYPEVAQVYDQTKDAGIKDLCKLLQRTESIAMQGYVCKRLQQDYPEIPIFTLHDCLITTEGNEGIIKKIMTEEIRNFLGYAPKMKTKQWNETLTKMVMPVYEMAA